MVAAHLLVGDHDLAVHEASIRSSGHTAFISLPNGAFRVDTGCIVCNDRACPNLLQLLAKLGVPVRPGMKTASDPSTADIDDAELLRAAKQSAKAGSLLLE